jgi:DNA-binding response OmpR family regulator
MTIATILVVEDDPSIQLGLRMSLERQDYHVRVAEDGSAGLEQLRCGDVDLLILDVMMPKMNGYQVLRVMKDENITVPVLVLSARTDDEDKVRGLDLGADDYVTKPFSVPEILARVRAALRRSPPRPKSSEIWRFGDVVVNAATREVHKSEVVVDLTVTEFNVLSTLAKTEGEALSRKQIFESVWGKDHHGTHRTIDNFMAQLRAKLEDNPTDPAFLLTVRGVGYRLVCE